MRTSAFLLGAAMASLLSNCTTTTVATTVGPGDDAVHCTNGVGDAATGGLCYSTTQSVTTPLQAADNTFGDGEIKEWHFHVYWFQTNDEQRAAAKRIQSELLEAVANKEFVVVLNGVTDEILPGVNTSVIPLFNEAPIGPHPCGSYEVWYVPR